jgi:competence protein ComEC
MKITFKEVGQGDSIILEWISSEGVHKLGVIDCNLKNGTNRVLDYIKSLDTFQFEFLILSHPHDDHFSGLLQLLTFIEERNIIVKYFLHTCGSKKEYLTASVKTISDRTKLANIFKKANLLYSSEIITNYAFVNDLTKDIELEDDFYLKFIGPTQSEYDKFNQIAFRNNDLTRNNEDANLLCTLIKVSNKNDFFLLTGDTPFDVFYKLNRKGNKEFKGINVLGQIPHHGSHVNFCGPFWKSLNRIKSNFACISVGVNSYGHPSDDVINKLNGYGYIVERTDSGEHIPSLSLSSSLDIVSVLVSDSSVFPKDLKYEFTLGECKSL